MTPGELAEELAAGRLRPAYLLAGEESLLREDALAAIRTAAFAGGSADFDCDRLDGAAVTPGALIDSVRTLPVLAPRRLVVLREPAERRAGATGLLDALAELVGELLRSERPTTLLVVSAGRPDKRARWTRAFAEPAARVACDAPRGVRGAAAFAREEARRQGLTLGAGAAELLADRVGPQLLLLRRELEKVALLAGPGGRVTREDVAASTSDVAEEPIWDLTDAIGEGRGGDALRTLHRLLGGGAPAPVVLGSLASHFRRLLRVRAGGAVPGPPFVVRKLEAQARRYRPERLLACLRAIHEVDEVLKGRGGIPADLALDRLVMGLAA